MNDELIMKKSNFKEGLKIVKDSTKSIKSDPKFFLKIIMELTVFVFVFNLLLSIIPKDNGLILFLSTIIYNFFTFLLIPSYVVQRLKNEVDLKFQIQTAINNIFSLRIFSCVILFFISLMITGYISMIPFWEVINSIGFEQFSQNVSFLTANIHDSQAIYDNKSAYNMMLALGNIDQIKIIGFLIAGGLFFVLSLVITFYTFFVSLYFEHIKFLEAFKFSLKLNFKNAGFFMASTLGIVLIAFIASLLSSIIYLSIFVEMVTLVYVYYIFTEITKTLIK